MCKKQEIRYGKNNMFTLNPKDIPDNSGIKKNIRMFPMRPFPRRRNLIYICPKTEAL
jgi:hypothetical protein